MIFELIDRGRRKTRKGDIFTSLRRRLSKTRSHSVVTGEPRAEETEEKQSTSDKEDPFKRSVSADRQSLLGPGRLTVGSGLGSARSSVSELSAISGHSTTTYVHENSTLVIECMENRIRKYENLKNKIDIIYSSYIDWNLMVFINYS